MVRERARERWASVYFSMMSRVQVVSLTDDEGFVKCFELVEGLLSILLNLAIAETQQRDTNLTVLPC